MENPADETMHDLHHEIQHHANEHGGGHLTRLALTTALIAAFAAVSGYLAGERADEALIEQIHAANHWSHYQAKSIKSSVLAGKMEMVQGLTGKSPSAADVEKLRRYEEEMKEIRHQAEEKQAEATHRLAQRTLLATGVTLFQISIAIGAISAVTRKSILWYASLVFGAGGLAILLKEVFFS
jgi:predicted transcriptional regulator